VVVVTVVTQPQATGSSRPGSAGEASEGSIGLYWLPLGAGGWFVKLNGQIWEAVHARLEHRRPMDLYHTALVVRVPEGRFVVENCWPILTPTAQRGACLSKAPSGSAAGALAGVAL
jgi:hypothetical protein